MQKLRNLLIVSILSLLTFTTTQAQDIVANMQTNSSTALCIGCSVVNPNNAVDGSDNTASTIQVGLSLLAGTVEQTLIFPTPGVAGDTVVLLLDASDSLLLSLNLLGNITVSSFLGATPNNEGATIVANNVSVLGTNAFEFRFYPTAAFDRVQITVRSGLLGLATSLDVFSAKIKRTVILPGGFGIVGCENPTAQSSSIAGLCLAGLCGVTNPTAIISADESDFALLRVTAGLLGGSAEITGTYKDTACTTDSATIVLENPGSLLTTNLLGSIEINALLNGVVVFTQTVQTANLNAISGSNLYAYNFKPNARFNAIQVRLTGTIAGLLNSLRVYQMCLKRLQSPRPAPNSKVVAVCFNTPATFTAFPAPGSVTRWYDAPVGGNLLFEGNTFVTGPLVNDTTYYIESFVPGGAGCASITRDSVMATVYPMVPNANDPQDDVFVCFNNQAFVTPKPFGSVFNFYSDPAGVNLLFTGGTYVTDTLLRDTIVYVENTFMGICSSNVYVPVNVKIIPDVFSSNLPDTLSYCVNTNIDIAINQPAPGITYRWYNLNGDTIFVGNPLTGFSLLSDTILTVETVSGSCTQSPNRDTVFIKAVSPPDVSIPLDTIYVCTGDTTFLTAFTTVDGATFNWYDSPTGTTPIFTGNPLKVAERNGDTLRFYVETNLDRCASSTRALGVVISLRDIDNTFNNDTTIVCRGNTATLTVGANIPGATYTWYNVPTGGTPIGTGSPFVTPPVTNNFTLFYFEVAGVSCVNTPRFVKTVDVIDTRPTVTPSQTLAYFCSGDSITLRATATPTSATISWWDNPTGGTKVADGNSFTFSPSANGSVFVQSNVDQCPSATRARVDFANADAINTPTAAGQSICAGQVARLTATSSVQGARFSWWTAAVGGTKLTEGAIYNTPVLNATTTYYVQLEFTDTTICKSRGRTAVTVTVEPILVAPTVTCGGADNTFVTFNWNTVAGALEYEYSLDGGVTFTRTIPSGTTTLTVNNLNPDSTVTIIVRATNNTPCATSPNSIARSCEANPCGLNNAEVEQAFYQACEGTPINIALTGLNAQNRVIINSDYANVRTGDVSDPSRLTYLVPNTLPGSYTFNFKVYSDGNVGCDTLELKINVRINPTPNATISATALVPPVPGQFIDTYQFFSNSVGDSLWSWNFGDGTFSGEENPVHQYANRGEYTVSLEVTSVFGCKDTDTLNRTIIVTNVPDIFIPNTFTPDGKGDEKNELFGVFGQNIRLESLKVFNNYGNLVFESTDLDNRWNGNYNGEPAPSATYAYKAVIFDSFGNKFMREGDVTIIRK